MNTLLAAPSHIIISGGLAQSSLLCQRLADLLQQSISRSIETEATARGLAFLVAKRPKTWPSEIIETFEPRHNDKIISHYFDWKTKLEQTLTENKEAVTP